MRKSKGTLQFKQNSTAADHFESTHHYTEPAFEPSAILQQKDNALGDANHHEILSNDSSKASEKLPTQLKEKMERSFDSNFSNVQIETNSAAAKNMGAKAYAQGNKLAFAPGAYDPNTKQGQNLIGHELTHVVQQRSRNIPVTQQFSGVNINIDNSLEKEADHSGKLAAKGEKTGMSSSTTSVKSNVAQGFGWNAGKDLMNKIKKNGQSKAKEGAEWGMDKVKDVKSTGISKGQDIWDTMKIKSSAGKEWAYDKKERTMDKVPLVPAPSLRLAQEAANYMFDHLRHKLAEIDHKFNTKVLPILLSLKAFIYKATDPEQIMMKIAQTIAQIADFLTQKINQLKDGLENIVDLRSLANFFRSLQRKVLVSSDDLYRVLVDIKEEIRILTSSE